jgi:large subunit ribosomal protein L4
VAEENLGSKKEQVELELEPLDLQYGEVEVLLLQLHINVNPKKINKKMYRSAMRSIWSKIAEQNKIVAVNELKIDEPVKSSQVKTILSNLGLKSALIVLASSNDNLIKASKNLTECNVLSINSIDPSALIKAENIILTSETIEKLTEALS